MKLFLAIVLLFFSTFSFGKDMRSIIKTMNEQSQSSKTHIRFNQKAFQKLSSEEQTEIINKLAQYSTYLAVGHDFYVLDKDVLFSKEQQGERITLIYSYMFCKQCYYFQQMFARIDEQKNINPNYRRFKNKQFYYLPLAYPASNQSSQHTFDFVVTEAVLGLISDPIERASFNQAFMIFGNTGGKDKLTSYLDTGKFFEENTDKINLENYLSYFSNKEIRQRGADWGKELASKLTFVRLPSIIVDGKFQIGYSKFNVLSSDEQWTIDILDMLSILSDLENRKIISFKNRS